MARGQTADEFFLARFLSRHVDSGQCAPRGSAPVVVARDDELRCASAGSRKVRQRSARGRAAEKMACCREPPSARYVCVEVGQRSTQGNMCEVAAREGSARLVIGESECG
eukprot:scaffold2419_cov114-Isochrysis_galbana.AAC.6